MDVVGHSMDVVGPGGLKGLLQSKRCCVSMALSLQLEAPGAHWISLDWELRVGGTGHTGQGCPIAARNLLQTGIGKSRKGVRLLLTLEVL